MNSHLLRLIALTGLALAAASVAVGVPAKRKPDLERGKEFYDRSCWMCHGREGRGDGPAAAALAGGVPSIVNRIDGESPDPFLPVVQNGRGRMPGFADSMDPKDTRRVLKYMATLGADTTKVAPDEPEEGDNNPEGGDAEPGNEAGGE